MDNQSLVVRLKGATDIDRRILLERPGTRPSECGCIEIWPNELDYVISELTRLREQGDLFIGPRF